MTGETCAPLQVADRSRSVADRYNWSGFYLGLNAGGAFGINTVTASGGGGSASVKEPGFLGGAQVGANYQTGPVVWGFEADYDASTQNQIAACGRIDGQHESNAVVRNFARPRRNGL